MKFGLLEIDQPPEVELERRARAIEADRLIGRQEIHVRLHEARLDARDLQRMRAHRADAVDRALVEQRVPQRERARRVDPQLVTEIAREAGARDHQLAAGEREIADVEGLRFSTPVQPMAFSTAQLVGPWKREAGDVVRLLDDRTSKPNARALQPFELPLLRAQPIVAFAEMEDRAVIDDLAVVVAPDAVADLARLDFRRHRG